LAGAAASRAGDYIRSASRQVGKSASASDWVSKGHHDWATEVDKNAEELIAEVLGKGAPGSRLVGEESSPELHRQGLLKRGDGDCAEVSAAGFVERAESQQASEDCGSRGSRRAEHHVPGPRRRHQDRRISLGKLAEIVCLPGHRSGEADIPGRGDRLDRLLKASRKSSSQEENDRAKQGPEPGGYVVTGLHLSPFRR
jgi:hypothetical protein